MKYLISLLLSINFLNASMLYDAGNVCIENFYVANLRFYYQKSNDMLWYSTSGSGSASYVKSNFIYEASTGKCVPDSFLLLGMTAADYNFLLGLIGVIIGGVFMFFLVNAFISVGGRK